MICPTNREGYNIYIAFGQDVIISEQLIDINLRTPSQGTRRPPHIILTISQRLIHHMFQVILKKLRLQLYNYINYLCI